MKPVFGDLGAKAALIASAKHEAAVQRALVAMRQLGIGVVAKCGQCVSWPYESEDCGWPHEHLPTYDSCLRGYGLDVLNDAARKWAAETKAESQEIPW